MGRSLIRHELGEAALNGARLLDGEVPSRAFVFEEEEPVIL
jgi:hypothetical protein